jgi:hypothetical protein
MKKLILFIILIASFSCATKKTTVEYKEKILIDTVRVFKDRIISKMIIDTLTVEAPCDSLGNLKEFEKTIKTDIAEIVLSNSNGKIQARINIDSIQQVWEKEFKSTVKKEVQLKEVKVTKFKIPLWIIIVLLCSLAFNVVLIRN